MDRISFYLDEHVAKAVAKGLRQRGIEVLEKKNMEGHVEFL